MSEAQKRVYDEVVSGPRGAVQGPLLAALHRPELADKWQQLGELLRFRTSLPKQLTELAIIITARSWDSRLEWHIHERIAREAGIPDGAIERIRRRQLPSLADFDNSTDCKDIADFTWEIQATRHVSDEAYQRVLDRWDTVGVVELTAVIGYYTMVAMTLNAHQFALPNGAADPFRDLDGDGRSGSDGRL